MDRREIRTPVGDIWLWSDFADHDPSRPLILVLRGAVPKKDDLEWLRPAGADIMFAHLPGFYCPLLVNDAIGVTLVAFDQVLRFHFADRRVILLGVSTGALVAVGLRCAPVVARVLVEPFFSTGDLQALQLVLKSVMPAEQKRAWQWCETVLGISLAGVEDRDYTPLLAADLPMIAIVGDEPLRPDCPTGFLPSLTSEADRQRLRDAGAELVVVRGGHDVPKNDPGAIVAALEAMARRVQSADATSG